jgi:hypothetical protein
MGVFFGCKKCLRTASESFIPPVFVDRVTGTAEVDNLLMMMRFDGDLAAHCENKVRQEIASYVSNILNNAGPVLNYSTCFMVQFDRFTIVARCKCNNKDLADGKGPPEANVKVWDSGYTIYPVDCDTREGISP